MDKDGGEIECEKSEEENVSTLHLSYIAYGSVDLNFDLRNVDYWGVKWDTLYVRHNKGEDCEEIPLTYTPEEDAGGAFKRPNDFNLTLNAKPYLDCDEYTEVNFYKKNYV